MILKGYFSKKGNWLSKNQMRLFCLYSNGEIKYFDNNKLQGSIWVRNDTEVVMNKKNEIVMSNIDSTNNKKEHTLVELQGKELKQINE